LVYMGFDEMDHVNLRTVHQSEDVKNVFKQYCQQGISPTLNGKFKNLCKVVKVYLAEAVSWLKEHDEDLFEALTKNKKQQSAHILLL